jgi:hypothetical protein
VESEARITIFISYSRADARTLKRLQVHLKPLERQYPITIWDDTRMRAGSRWREELADAIRTARVAVLLISADFLASEFIVENELPPLLAAAKALGTVILPVILSPCRYDSTPGLSEFQALNDPARPLSGMTRNKQEELLVQVAHSIEAVVGEATSGATQRVTGSEEIKSALLHLIASTEEKGYITISSDPYYVQFAYFPTEAKGYLYWEAVSNRFLDSEHKLSSEQIARLESFGLSLADADSNFQESRPVKDEGDLDRLANLAWAIMHDVYGCNPSSTIMLRRHSWG